MKKVIYSAILFLVLTTNSYSATIIGHLQMVGSNPWGTQLIVTDERDGNTAPYATYTFNVNQNNVLFKEIMATALTAQTSNTKVSMYITGGLVEGLSILIE